VTRWWIGWASLWLASGCGGGEGAGPSPKQSYEQAIAELTEPVGLVAAFRPHLDEAELGLGRYTPRRRADEVRVRFYAANEIRHAANVARQRRPMSSVTQSLVPALEQISIVCADADEPSDLDKCRERVLELDKLLADHERKAVEAGAQGKLPRVAPAFVTAAAKTALARFQRAAGPSDAERKYLAMYADTSVTADPLIASCDAVAAEADGVFRELERAGDPDLQKLGAIHKLAVEAQCNRLKAVDGLAKGLADCADKLDKKPGQKPPTKEEREAQERACIDLCANVATLVREGVPAAAFEFIKEKQSPTCEEYEKKRKK
jgi:hypothetical protein